MSDKNYILLDDAIAKKMLPAIETFPCPNRTGGRIKKKSVIKKKE
jgi:hypothetical protein